MQFMTVFTYEPAHRNEVIKRRLESGAAMPAGLKKLGEWSYVGSGKVFTLVEVTDPMAAFEATRAWSDLGKLEMYPVLETERILPALASSVLAVGLK